LPPTSLPSLHDALPISSPLIRLEGAAAGYVAGDPVLEDLDLRLDADDRVGLLGANGNGKSTFAKLIAGRMAPMAGRRYASDKIRSEEHTSELQSRFDLV